MQHIKEQYAALKPILDALVTAYPQFLQAAWFSWEAYIWAVQLGHAYAMGAYIGLRLSVLSITSKLELHSASCLALQSDPSLLTQEGVTSMLWSATLCTQQTHMLQTPFFCATALADNFAS